MSAVGSLPVSDRPTVLLIGLQSVEAREIADRAAKERWRTIVCSNANQAHALLQGSSDIHPAAILLHEDVDPGRTYNAISAFKRRDSRVPVFLVGDSSAVRPSQHAVRTGANEYLARPLVPEQVLQNVRAAVDGTAARVHELERQTAKPAEPISFSSLIGNSPAFRAAVQLASQCATGAGHILIEGENGTGKDTLARAIHSASLRSQKPLETVQVEGVSEVTLRSRLFGHVRGAFVGAFETQTGLLQRRTGATILLDQANRLPIPIQQRLVQALHERRTRSIGGTQDYSVDVRVVALSSEAISGLVERGAFDARLFDLLGQTRIGLPPIRERRDDIGLLAQHFLRTIPVPEGTSSLTLDEEAISVLRRCDWPGNIRQLHEALLRAAAQSGNCVLGAEHFNNSKLVSSRRSNGSSSATSNAGGIVSLFTAHGHVRPLEDIETDIIRLAIERYEGRMSEVARRLGIGRSTLYRKMAHLSDEGSSRKEASTLRHPAGEKR